MTASASAGRSDRIAVWVAVVAALLGLVSGGTAMVFSMWPELRPDPRDRQGADVTVVAVEPRVAYDDWLRRTSRDAEDLEERRGAYLERAALPGEPLTAEQVRALLAAEGHALFARLRIEGYKRRNVALRWSMYEAGTRRRVEEAEFSDVAAADVDLDAPTDRSVVQLWVPHHPAQDRVFVRMELVSRDGTVLAVGDSPAFAE